MIIFRFKTMGYKSAHVGKQYVFFGKQWVFKSNVFDITSHVIFFIIKHMHFIKIKTIHVLHKFSFYNAVPHRSHSLIGHVIHEL